MGDSKHSNDRYHTETRLIHGRLHDVHWDYRDHIVPPISASAAYKLESAERGAEGFAEFANPEFNREEHDDYRRTPAQPPVGGRDAHAAQRPEKGVDP